MPPKKSVSPARRTASPKKPAAKVATVKKPAGAAAVASPAPKTKKKSTPPPEVLVANDPPKPTEGDTGATPKAAAAKEHPEPVVVSFQRIKQLVEPGWSSKLQLEDRVDLSKHPWPILYDASSRAAVFFQYSGANVIDAFDRSHMDRTTVRRMLLGALRFGKALVINTHDVDMVTKWVSEALDAVRPGLLQDILDGSITERAKWEPLIEEDDGPSYAPAEWPATMTKDFCFAVVSSGTPASVTPPVGLFPLVTSPN